MANIKEDPKVQELIAAAREKEAKAVRKAIVNAVKAAAGSAVDDAKATESSKDVVRAIKDTGSKLVEAAKLVEVE